MLLLLVACDAKAGGSSRFDADERVSSAIGRAFDTKPRTEAGTRLVETHLDRAKMVGYVIRAPEGAQVRFGVPGGGAEIVDATANYSIAIREEIFDAREAKTLFNLLDPDGKVITESADLVIFQRKGGSVMFGLGVLVGGKSFRCGTVATAIDFDREKVDQMIASCKTLKVEAPVPSDSAPSSPPLRTTSTSAIQPAR